MYNPWRITLDWCTRPETNIFCKLITGTVPLELGCNKTGMGSYHNNASGIPWTAFRLYRCIRSFSSELEFTMDNLLLKYMNSRLVGEQDRFGALLRWVLLQWLPLGSSVKYKGYLRNGKTRGYFKTSHTSSLLGSLGLRWKWKLLKPCLMIAIYCNIWQKET